VLEFVEATLKWGDIAMRTSASAHRQREIRELERLAAEQAALRRLATFLVRAGSANDVFDKVAEELSRLLAVTTVRMVRFEGDGTATLVAAREPAGALLAVGTNMPLPRGTVIDWIFRTGQPARVDDYSQVEGPIGEALRGEGLGWAAGGPIIVDGRLWGAIVVSSPFPEHSSDIENRVAQFAELVSTAISTTESRAEVERLAAKQSALRRVAELIARQAPAPQVFARVTEELSRLLEVPIVRLLRFEPDGIATILATCGVAHDRIPPGTIMPVPVGSVVEQVLRTGRAAPLDDFSEVQGPIGAIMREQGRAPGLGVPSPSMGVCGARWRSGR
jgi:GAF domain-containing protein